MSMKAASASNRQPVIGILTWGEDELIKNPYLRHFSEEGELLGAFVFYFSPGDLSEQENKCRGFVPLKEGGWVHGEFHRPDIVIDRCHQYRKGKSLLEPYFSLRKHASLRFANNPIGSKLHVHHALAQVEKMNAWLPHTVAYSEEALREMLSRYPVLYIKPSGGTGGRGVLRIISRDDGSYSLLGRNQRREKMSLQLHSLDELLSWMNPWVRRTHFIIQQGLQLDLIPNRSADLRLLIQKNEEGRWAITGFGMRIGEESSPTSNLHGGGKGVLAGDVLEPIFGPEKTRDIIEECLQLGYETAHAIGNSYPALIELGIDIGIDVKGDIWLIELNSMPQREIFNHIGKNDLYHLSFRRPIQYALYLIAQTAQLHGNN